MIDFLTALFEPGEVFEVRLFGATTPTWKKPRIESGYFSLENAEKIPNALANYDNYVGAYVTLDPVNPALIARSENRIRAVGRGEATSNDDILCLRWLFLDVDPRRPSGISSTDTEKQRGYEKAVECKANLAKCGWPDPIFVDSGNGYYLIYRVDLVRGQENVIAECLECIGDLSDEYTHIDPSVKNAARILRLPGTWNRKGDSIVDRPHRKATIIEIPDQIETVTEEAREKVASVGRKLLANKAGKRTQATAKTEKRAVPGQQTRPGDDYNTRGDIEQLLQKHGWQCLGVSGNNQRWKRPGKEAEGLSATWNGEHFYVFSSNASPFAPNEPYTAFAVYATLEHDADYQAASEALAALGYGDRPEVDDPNIDGFINAMATSKVSSEKKTPDTGPDHPDPGRLPDALMCVPGFVEQFIDYSLSIAKYASHPLSFCGAMSCLAYMCGRKILDDKGTAPNIYMVALADSSSGKNTPRLATFNILKHANYTEGIRNNFASAEGMEQTLITQQNILFQTDEFDGIIRALGDRKDANEVRKARILKEIYTSSNSHYLTRVKAHQETIEIMMPHVTLFGVSVPSVFFDAMSKPMLIDGLIGRMTIIDVETKKYFEHVNELQKPPQSLIDAAEYWKNCQRHKGNLISEQPQPEVAPVMPDASEMFVGIVRGIDAGPFKAAQDREDDIGMAIWGRASEKIAKFALLYACSRNHMDPVVDIDAISWAWAFIEHLTKRMLYLVDSHVADGEFQRNCNTAMDAVTKYDAKHGAAMPRWKLSRALRGLRKKEVDEVILTLESQGRVVLGSQSSSGRTGQVVGLA